MTIKGKRSAPINCEQNKKKYNLRRANWDLLRHKYVEQPPLVVGRVDDMAKAMTTKIKRALDVAVPKVKPTSKITNKMWTEHLSVPRAEAKTIPRFYQALKTEEERNERLQIYREAIRIYEQELYQTKKRSWGTFVEECLQLDVWGTPCKIASEKIHPPILL